MTLSMNEIRKRAIEFSKNWQEASDERADSQTFWNDFFYVFGVNRKKVAVFEKHVKKLGGEYGFIDVFWPGTLICEQKSRGRDLESAINQGIDYLSGIKDIELPSYIIVSDFQRIKLVDLDNKTENEIELKELYNHIDIFGFMAGYVKRRQIDEDPVNIDAAYLMGKLHDGLKASGYEGHKLEVYLVRILFCLFADDTGIFEKDDFTFYIEGQTREDGVDLGSNLNYIFQILNTPENDRPSTLHEDLKKLPYVNGKLFEEVLEIPAFDSSMREVLLECCYFNWSKISPAIFGSMFQSVMNQEERHELGAHYTSEMNIMKTIKGLFLDELQSEFEKNKNSVSALENLRNRIGKIKILDPACGCGNFLITAYKHLRLLEIEINKSLMKLKKTTDRYIDIASSLSVIDVDMMFGIEIGEFPARVAEVAMWLIDHQMNMQMSAEFGQYYNRLPLTKSPNIYNANALRINWEDIVAKNELTYILGNPPFVAKKNRDENQNNDMALVFNGFKTYGVLDYVAAWYLKAANYMRDTDIKCAFVSTNSITQGEQVGILAQIFNLYAIKINFAHRTFKWTNEAKNKAAVYCVIIGFSNKDDKNKLIFDYEKPTAEPMETKAKNINAYLINFENTIIPSRNQPLCDVPEIVFGNMPNDNGNFLFTDEEKKEFLKEEPLAKKFIKPLISAREYLNGEKRWCLWLRDIKPSEIKQMPKIAERISNVKEYRLKSSREATRDLARYPHLFGEIRQPETTYILVPRVSSENRLYVPISYFKNTNIIGDTCLAVVDATLYHFGVLTSAMHMAWMRQVCGRLKSDYRYSNNLVYNNFPWPKEPSEAKKKKVEEAAKAVLAARKEFSTETLADLYNPISMPKILVDTHKKLDKAVDKCYRSQPFTTELNRLEFLFALYNEYTSPLDSKNKKR